MSEPRKLVRRQQAVEATMERYRGKAFALGSVDCAKLIGFHLKRFGIKLPFSKGGPYRSALSAQRALRRVGCETVIDLMDSIGLQRIPPAAALMGDIVSCEADNPLGGLAIVVGPGNILCFSEEHQLPVIVATDKATIAWRVI